MLRYGVEVKKLDRIWCRYFEGNIKSNRVREKCGFIYHHMNRDIYCKLMDEIRMEYVTCLSRDDWRGMIGRR